MMMRGRLVGVAAALVALVMAVAVLACGGKQKEASSEPQAPAPAPATPQGSSDQASGAPPSGSSVPLIDSRGNPVPGMPAAAPAAGGGGLVWTKPAGWNEEPPSSSMRKAQYSLPAAPGDPEPGQCAVFYFGVGQGGDIQGNVERWASQFADAGGNHPTPKVSEGKVAGMKMMKVFTEGTYTPSPMMGGDLTPKPGQELLGAIVEGPDSNWFFKCTGPKKTMESHRKEFDALVDSVRTP